MSRRRLQLSPLILSTNYITGAMPIKCELAHKSADVFNIALAHASISDAENCSAAYQNDNECQWEPYAHDAKYRESNFEKQGSIRLHATNRHDATPTSPREPFARRPRMNNQNRPRANCPGRRFSMGRGSGDSVNKRLTRVVFLESWRRELFWRIVFRR
jgi:hypothetical protein